ncbi:hypothetical protein P4233_30975 [Pseudomonas aeruginosa]|nr:hypothetical protein [Pseudomonas aeruginosa]
MADVPGLDDNGAATVYRVDQLAGAEGVQGFQDALQVAFVGIAPAHQLHVTPAAATHVLDVVAVAVRHAVLSEVALAAQGLAAHAANAPEAAIEQRIAPAR